MSDDISEQIPYEEGKIVISLGGDGSFLRTSHLIMNEMPMIGINTDEERSVGSLCKFKVNSSTDLEEIAEYLRKLDEEKLMKRSRL